MATPINNTILYYDTQLSSVYKTIDHLKKAFPGLVVVKSETEFFDFLKNNSADVLIVNLDVSPMDGIAITREAINQIEEKKPYVIVYSNKQDDFLQELAYNSGVDAFISANYSPVLMELLVKSLLRRIKATPPAKSKSNELIVDEEEFLVIKNGVKIELPKKEFKMLLLMQRNDTKFFSKKELAKEIWNDEEIAKKRTIDVHIYNIRQIFGKHIIQSQKGKGYRINKKYFA